MRACMWGFLGGTMVKNPLLNPGDTREAGSIPGSGRSLGVGNGNLLQDSCLENSTDRGAWWVIVHGVTKSQTQLNTAKQQQCICINILFLFNTIVCDFYHAIKINSCETLSFIYLVLLYHAAFRIIVPQPGIKPMTPTVEA